MKIINQEKLANLLTQNWTKFLDYKNLMELVINTVQLYASNWSMLEYCGNIQGNKISVSKTEFNKTSILFYIYFEVLLDESVAMGTLELNVPLNGQHTVNKINGNIFYNN
jgi:hypothetical protein